MKKENVLKQIKTICQEVKMNFLFVLSFYIISKPSQHRYSKISINTERVIHLQLKNATIQCK